MDFVVIHSYGLDQAIADGILYPVFQNRWPELSGGKPIVVSLGIHNEFSDAAVVEIWNKYVNWRKNVMPTLPEEERMFQTLMNNQRIWLLEDAAAFTILFPEER